MISKTRLRFFVSFGFAVLTLQAGSSTVMASLQLKITTTINGVTSSETLQQTSSRSTGDRISRSIDNTPDNSISFHGFTIDVLTGNSIFANRDLNISSINVQNSNGSAGTLVLELTEDAYSTPGTYGLNLTSTATVQGLSVGSTASFQSFAGNSAFDKSFSSPPINFNQVNANLATTTPSTMSSGFKPTGATFSITSDSTFNLAAGGSAQFASGDSVVSTPEPSTMALALTGLPVAGVLWARRRKASRVTVG